MAYCTAVCARQVWSLDSHRSEHIMLDNYETRVGNCGGKAMRWSVHTCASLAMASAGPWAYIHG